MDVLVYVTSLLFVVFYGAESANNHDKKTRSFDIHHRMSDVELQKYFGVSSSSNVPDYDISFPIHADERGVPVSKDRNKRDVDSSDLRDYHMTAFGDQLHLKVTQNKNLLGPNFYVETRHKDGTRTIADAPHRNFYHGHVVSHPNSFVAVADNNGVSGAIHLTDDEMLFVHPLPRHLMNSDQDNEQHPHLVVKRSAMEFQDEHRQMFEAEENPQTNFKRMPASFPAERAEREEDKHRFMEVAYVGDHLIAEQIGLRELPDMLLIIGNIVSRMFTDSTFGEIKLTYVVTKLVILNNGELNYNSGASNGVKLDKFGDWLNENNPGNDDDPDHVDTGTLFTSFTGGGLALVGGMCTWNMKAVVGAIGLSSSVIAAHENFHNLGYGHDGNSPDCPNGANIMSTYVPSGKAAFTWSNCSRKYIQDYLKSKWSHCLREAPTRKRPSLPNIIRDQLPGVVFDGDKQCEYKQSLGFRQCSVSCAHLFCGHSGSCWSTGGAPADGTRCGEGKWCIRGECVDDGSPAVDGNWGSWSEFSPCSRSCGAGVQHRSRKCNNPSPKNGGKQCPAAAKDREDRICSTLACPSGSESFRQLQCKSKGVNNTAFIRKKAECYLWCWAGNGVGYLYGQVIDGTRCYGDQENNDICIRGVCKALGCDNKLSGQEKDRCGKCGGDGSSCELHIISYTKDHRRYGFDHADTMVTLKKGSMNVHVKMQGKTWNMIGVQNKDGKYLIKLPSWTKTVYENGMKITYIRKKNQYNDEIIIPGTVTEELKVVFIHIQSKNQGVVTRFYTPVNTVTKPPEDTFYWGTGNWSACSKTCAGGKSSRNVRCFRRDDYSRVGDVFCAGKLKPHVEKSCNVQNCPAVWHSYLTRCSKTCGKGIQIKKTECRRLTAQSWMVVDDSECKDSRPTSVPYQRHCNEVACAPEYATEPWSQCSTTCGEGTMTRGLKCQIINNEGRMTILPISTCEHYSLKKPLTKERCNYDKPCTPMPKYTEVGCFKDGKKERVLPNMLANLRPQIDWKNPTATIERCARLAQEHKIEYFAIQFYGECWSSSRSVVPHYDKYGLSNDCWAGLGGGRTNYVYKMMK